MRLLTAAACLAAALFAGAAAPAPPKPIWNGCSAGLRDAARVQPLTPGPLRLASVSCLERARYTFHENPALSPDGRSVAWLSSTGPLEAGPLAGARLTRYPVDLGVHAAFIGSWGDPDTIQWDAAGRSVWTALQDHQRPTGGWATGPMRPVRTRPDGTFQALPPLTHPSGTLDSLLWVGHGGRALAQFGTMGGYYRPKHDDPEPALAMVDAARGRVLDSLRIRDVADPSRGRNAFTSVSAVILPDGRMRALLRLATGGLVLWTQGAKPRLLADPYPGDRSLRLRLAPGGARVLVTRVLPASATCQRTGGCTHGEPASGPIAALHELATGRRLWAVSATDVWPTSYPAAISPDGRLALIGLPRRQDRNEFAVVSMRDGHVLQTVRATINATYGLGFVRGGRAVWVSDGSVVTVYEVSSAPA